jgi:hypothetical protein
MSVVYNSYNQILRSTVSVPSVGSTNTFFITLPWHPQSLVDGVRVWITNATSATITNLVLINNGAHFRDNPNDKAHIAYKNTTSTVLDSAANYWGNYDLNPGVYVDELYNRPFAYVKIITSAAVSSAFSVSLIGRKALPTNIRDSDRTGVVIDNKYRVLMGRNQTGSGGTSGQIYDITGPMSKRGGDNTAQASIASTYDYVYVGTVKQNDTFEFNLSGIATSTAPLVMQYWNGSTWSSSSVVALDNTSTGNGDAFRFSGIIESRDTLTSMVPTVLTGALPMPLDPLYTLQQNMNSGLTQPVNTPANPPRYWWRFGLGANPGGSTGTAVTFTTIYPLLEPYL